MKNICRVAVFDDDRLMGHMTKDIALAPGYACRHFLSRFSAAQEEFGSEMTPLECLMACDGMSLEL